MAKQTTNTDRIIRRPAFRELAGISSSTEWRMSQRGELPKSVVVGGRVLGYLESSVNEWLTTHTV
ncbi:AlpA family phage regulatory protein [Vibrio hannami]|uniref:helix-turn-helix transcriptional regulator n=1 Tax=Vibrio hannami TaxID=2717094 RepID=UPI00240F5F58|nr:AlpA family phage regulatory protein [Vibrio hannami]MDG3089113.1 AlpA family phage regulatory protein [Vibrio hannami]